MIWEYCWALERGSRVVKPTYKETDPLENGRVEKALKELLNEIRAADVPPSIVALAETLQRRLDEAEQQAALEGNRPL